MSDSLYDDTPRNGHGVKQRLDGKGDAWASAHRQELGCNFHMQDIDASFGAVVFGQNTGEKLFLEYVPDNYQNREKRIREFAVIALFDRKATEEAAFANHSTVSRAFYLWQCRVFGTKQPIDPKFFLVIGRQEPPWKMIEVDIFSSETTGVTATINAGEWHEVWRTLGLTDMRNEIAKWLQTPIKT